MGRGRSTGPPSRSIIYFRFDCFLLLENLGLLWLLAFLLNGILLSSFFSGFSSPPPDRLAFLPVPGAKGAAPRFALKGMPLFSALSARLAPFWSGTW